MKRLLLLGGLAACAGSAAGPAPAPAPAAAEPAPLPSAAITPAAATPSEPAEPPPDRPPEVFPPAWTRVGVGQRVAFAVTAIDQDLDETRVLVTELPASARFDAVTQTVTWTPTRRDRPAGRFVLEVANLGPDGEPVRTWSHTWEIEVVGAKQPTPVAPRLSAVVETLLTIREPARLARVNQDWPFDKLLVRAAELQRAQLPADVQARLAPLDRKDLFRSFLTGLAQTHDNPRLDPRARAFDRKVFGDPKRWRLVAVRPRIDKKWAELRLVYQAVDAAEPVFAMFRLRPTWDAPDLPPEARAYNNKVFLGRVADRLLDGGAASERFLADPKAHARAVAALVGDLLGHDDSATHPWARAGFLALPTEARMGGGSRRHADGSYRSGDGWAWSVMKPLPTADGSRQAYVAIPIPGFWTQAVPSPDGTTWVARCAPRFDPDDPGHAPGYPALCRKALGLVDLPEVVDGKVTAARKDAVNLFVEHKRRDAVALLPLEDPRRDHGEENGMTCAQCHIRNFTVRDHTDPATADPRHGVPARPNAPLATLDFQIVPSASWPAYTLESMKAQECSAARQLEQFLGAPSALTCPLLPAP
jgi:hypothetical protein